MRCYKQISCIFSLGAFDNPLTLKNIQDEDIDDIEQSIRENRFFKLKNVKNIEEVFGKEFGSNLSNFQFKRGDRELIKELSKHVKNKINNIGLQYFTSVPSEQINKNSCNIYNGLQM